MSFNTKTYCNTTPKGFITLSNKSSHPDPTGDNKQSACKLSLIF